MISQAGSSSGIVFLSDSGRRAFGPATLGRLASLSNKPRRYATSRLLLLSRETLAKYVVALRFQLLPMTNIPRLQGVVGIGSVEISATHLEVTPMLLPPSVKLLLLYDAVVAYLFFSRALASILHRQEPDDGIDVWPLDQPLLGKWARIWGPQSFSDRLCRPV